MTSERWSPVRTMSIVEQNARPAGDPHFGSPCTFERPCAGICSRPTRIDIVDQQHANSLQSRLAGLRNRDASSEQPSPLCSASPAKHRCSLRPNQRIGRMHPAFMARNLTCDKRGLVEPAHPEPEPVQRHWNDQPIAFVGQCWLHQLGDKRSQPDLAAMLELEDYGPRNVSICHSRRSAIMIGRISQTGRADGKRGIERHPAAFAAMACHEIELPPAVST